MKLLEGRDFESRETVVDGGTSVNGRSDSRKSNGRVTVTRRAVYVMLEHSRDSYVCNYDD